MRHGRVALAVSISVAAGVALGGCSAGPPHQGVGGDSTEVGQQLSLEDHNPGEASSYTAAIDDIVPRCQNSEGPGDIKIYVDAGTDEVRKTLPSATHLVYLQSLDRFITGAVPAGRQGDCNDLSVRWSLAAEQSKFH